MKRKILYPYIKRCLDVVFSLFALIVLSPVLLVTSLLVRINLGNPVLFAQLRPGLNGKSFTLYKFRTMKNTESGASDNSDAARLTRFGRVLRSTSLDELPSLWNILIGDMSFVGPRPLLVEYLPRYTSRQNKRHEVRPGLTGLAQSTGRNLVPWNQRLELDAIYVEKYSFFIDCLIVLRTISLVLRRVGTTAPGNATMPEFVREEQLFESGNELSNK